MLPLRILLNILLGAIHVVTAEDLLELTCFDDKQCKQYQHSGVNATCNGGHCQCQTADKEATKCTPKDLILSNIIGGHCPCAQPHAECNSVQDICYCTTKHMPSTDRRRCIPDTVPLDGKCELDTQCTPLDNYAACLQDVCQCREGFINLDGMCTSLVGKNSTCSNDTECQLYGTNATCDLSRQRCVCAVENVSALNNTDCLPTANHQDKCTESLQCVGNLGPGGLCQDGVCVCDDQYYLPLNIKTNEGTNKTVCSRIPEIGQYCRDNDDCHHHQWPETMDCFYGECNCKWGYYSYDDGGCKQSSGPAQPKANQPFLFAAACAAIFANSFIKSMYKIF